MADRPDLARLIRAEQTRQAGIRDRLEQIIRRRWLGLGSWRDADMERWIAQIVPVLLAAERQAGVLTAAFLARYTAAVLGGRAAPARVDWAQVTGEPLRAVDPAEVYQRPGVQTWTALSQGAPIGVAVQAGLDRALSLAATDVKLARTHTARRLISGDDRIVGHRRTLTGAENCGLCVVASTQRYHRGELQPIHPGCDCGVEPIYGQHDPGRVLDPETLEQAHDAIKTRFGVSDRGARSPIDYRKQILVEHHGELGPVLTVKGQHFTGPAAIN